MNGALYRFLWPLVTWLIHRLAIVRVEGQENIPPGGGVLLVSNHLTNFDVFVIGVHFMRMINFMGKIEVFENPAFAWFCRQMYVFPVRRGEPDRGALRYAEQMLKLGRVVGVFPEGHRSHGEGVQKGQPGIALLARRTGTPILPVAITGTERFWPPAVFRWRPWRRPLITVTIGQPFTLAKGRGRGENRAAADDVMIHVARLLPPEAQGVYRAAIAAGQSDAPASSVE